MSTEPDHCHEPSDRERTTRGDDLAIESAVLNRVIDVHPLHLHTDELVRELAGEEPEFRERDAIQRAAKELSHVGLIHLNDGFVWPTRAAMRFVSLLDR